jgi:hypothetical protein
MPLALLTLGLALGCEAHPEAPLVCLDMCQAAEGLYGQCLEDWGLGWPDAGHESGESFVDSCTTWTWELQVLEEEEIQAGQDVGGRTQDFCEQRFNTLSANEATCAAYTDQEWGHLL